MFNVKVEIKLTCFLLANALQKVIVNTTFGLTCKMYQKSKARISQHYYTFKNWTIPA